VELRLAREANAALLQRLVRERKGHQIQLESTVAHWMERVQELEGSDE
jgi:hypothetical protein